MEELKKLIEERIPDEALRLILLEVCEILKLQEQRIESLAARMSTMRRGPY